MSNNGHYSFFSTIFVLVANHSFLLLNIIYKIAKNENKIVRKIDKFFILKFFTTQKTSS